MHCDCWMVKPEGRKEASEAGVRAECWRRPPELIATGAGVISSYPRTFGIQGCFEGGVYNPEIEMHDNEPEDAIQSPNGTRKGKDKGKPRKSSLNAQRGPKRGKRKRK